MSLQVQKIMQNTRDTFQVNSSEEWQLLTTTCRSIYYIAVNYTRAVYDSYTLVL